jgi:phosphoribosylglycinamide formyltransferase-1
LVAVVTKARVGILISGRGSNMAALVEASEHRDCPYSVVLVASNDPEAAGLAFAAARGIPTFAHSHKGMKRADFDAIIDAELRRADATHVALAGYMRLLSPGFVQGWAGRMINIHPSLLPAYKGLDTHARALADGATVHGCSVHLVTKALDDGPVIGRAEVPVLPGDTPDTLAARVLGAEHRLYPEALARFVMDQPTISSGLKK